jgi:hypothetical protein
MQKLVVKMQYLGLVQEGKILVPSKNHAQYQPIFKPLSDGISFRFKAFFSDTSKTKRLLITPKHRLK